MSSDLEVSVEEEVSRVGMPRPHVVVLGAGASRATCLAGDKNGKVLPLMLDFTKALGLESVLNTWGIDPNQNFENIFSDLFERGETRKLEEIQTHVEEYFEQLELPDHATVYDHLVLSLRDKDLVATFNWDPLLMQAYLRNSKSGLSLPKLAFLHGNVRVGYCEKDKVMGLAGRRCRHCGNCYQRAPLLYPIKKKEYAHNTFITNEWQRLEWGFQNAFMITVFGYSAPKTDEEAKTAMLRAWGGGSKRSMEQTSFITMEREEEVADNWKAFIHSHHYEVHNSFYESWIANHPRRTGEAYWNQYYEAKFIDNNPLPRHLALPELWDWHEQFKRAEQKVSTKG
jgi:hypothetical protein